MENQQRRRNEELRSSRAGCRSPSPFDEANFGEVFNKSGVNNGKLPKFGRGRLRSKAFEEVAFSLKEPNEISKPFKSEFLYCAGLLKNTPIDILILTDIPTTKKAFDKLVIILVYLISASSIIVAK